MKKSIFLMAAALLGMTTLFGQSEKYLQVMEQKVTGIDTIRSAEGLQELANTFERIATAEKTQWLPYYYAALSNVNLGYSYVFAAGPMGGNADKSDPLADKAQQLLDKAEELSKDNSEIFIVKKMLATLRMMGDVMNRYMTYGPAAGEALAMAKKILFFIFVDLKLFDISAYKPLLITSSLRSIPKLMNTPRNTNIFEGGTIASLRYPL